MSQQALSKDQRGSVEQTWSRNTMHVSKLALPLRILNLRKLGGVHLDALCPAGFLQMAKMRNMLHFFFFFKRTHAASDASKYELITNDEEQMQQFC